MRDHRKLEAFELADRLIFTIYQSSDKFPTNEVHGLQAQVRRAAVSIASNIVEGCARSSQSEYARFIEIAYGSAQELQYQISLCVRLGLVSIVDASRAQDESLRTAKALNSLLRGIRRAHLQKERF